MSACHNVARAWINDKMPEVVKMSCLTYHQTQIRKV
jgi:hypothetical protein